MEPVSHPEQPILVEDDNVPAKCLEGKDDVVGPFFSSDRFTRSGLDLLEHTAHQYLDFHKTIQDSYRAEEYAHDYSRIMAKLNKNWQDKKLARPFIPTSFSNPLPSDHSDPRFKKGKGRRMAGRELAEKEEALKRRECRQLSIERAWREKYKELHQNDIERKYITSILLKIN